MLRCNLITMAVAAVAAVATLLLVFDRPLYRSVGRRRKNV